VTNSILVDETSLNTSPEEKNVRGHGILHPHRLKRKGGTWGTFSPHNCADGYTTHFSGFKTLNEMV